MAEPPDQPPVLDYGTGRDGDGPPPTPRDPAVAFVAFCAGAILSFGPVLFVGANLYFIRRDGFSGAPARPQPDLAAAFAATAAAAIGGAVWWGYRGRRLRWFVMGLLLGTGVGGL